MPSVRTQLTVGSEMSLEFARLDMSKLCDTRNCHEKGIVRGRAARKRRAALWVVKRKVGECVVTGCPWGVSRQRDEVRTMVASGTIARGSLL